MKISVFPTLLLIIVVVAIGYLAYDMAHSRADASELLVGIVAGFSVLLTLGLQYVNLILTIFVGVNII